MSETPTAAPVERLIADESPCPAPRVIGMIGGKWKLLILQILIFQGIKKFGELRKMCATSSLPTELSSLSKERLEKRTTSSL